MAAALVHDRAHMSTTPMMVQEPPFLASDPQFSESPNPSAPRYLPHPSQGPPPNPQFSFPVQPAPLPAFVAQSRRAGRRPMSAIEPCSIPMFSMDDAKDDSSSTGPAALPAFNFNPGATADSHASAFLSPLSSPGISRIGGASTQRPGGHGHRRGGSEFVGGRLREGNSIAVMSTSPTKSESGLASPGFQPPRRGHRRGISGAISVNDLPILNAPALPEHKGSSAPTSPTNFNEHIPIIDPAADETPPLPQSEEQITEPATANSTTTEDVDVPEVSPRPTTRARVGFSDTLEYIPRPLSLVSSDTSSTVTATWSGHNFSDSISSVMEPDHDNSTSAYSPSRESSNSRPSTAGAILERALSPEMGNHSQLPPKRRYSNPNLPRKSDYHAAAPATPSSKTSKRWSFFGLEPGSPKKGTRTDTGPVHSDNELDSEAVFVEPDEEVFDNADDSQRSPKNGKKGKKRRVKGWAGAILHGKSKGSKPTSTITRPPTPPAPASAVPEDEEDEEESVHEEEPRPTPTVTVTGSEGQPNETRAPRPEEVTSPMIDLDAALGPFNTPVPYNPEWEAAQRAAGNVAPHRRRLHSAQGMRGFSGPGGHYHRRAESAPALPPFEAGLASANRLGNSSTMADVFEEDEDEEEDERVSSRQSSNDGQSDSSESSDGDLTPPAMTGETEPALDTTKVPHPSLSVRRQSSGLSRRKESTTPSVHTERSKSSLHDSVISADATPSIIFRNANVLQARRGSNDSNSAKLPRKTFANLEVTASADSKGLYPNASNLPHSPYALSQASSFPSPRSLVSVDPQRVSTAPSSVSEETSFRSLLMGEPGPEVRTSMDYDVPSLTSSTSTMTRESAFPSSLPSQRLSQPSLRDQRPVSVSSAAFGRRRSSLVSLSRLISSSHGERSKLSMEVTLDDGEARKPRQSKKKRLGRMMQFWKPSKEQMRE